MDQKQLTERVRSYLDEIEWKYDFNEEHNFFMSGASLEGAMNYTRLVVDVEDELLQCYAIATVEVPAEKRVAASEYLTRANYGLKRGAFELDFSDGEVRFHAYMDVTAGMSVPDDEAMELLVLMPIAMMERYGSGLLDVISGVKTPEAACAAAETDEGDSEE